MNITLQCPSPARLNHRIVSLFGLIVFLFGALIVLGSNVIGLLCIAAGLLLQHWFSHELYRRIGLWLGLGERVLIATVLLLFVLLLSPKGFLSGSVNHGIALLTQHFLQVGALYV